MFVKIVPKTFEQLVALSQPSSGKLPEALLWPLYSTKSYVSGTTTKLVFFDTVESDKTLSNMETAGSLPDPQFYEIHGMGCDILLDGSVSGANTEVGALDDVAKLILTSRSMFTLNISNKQYGPVPLTFAHASGGPTGVAFGTLTAPQGVQFANNGIFDGGWPVGGGIVIPPKVGFNVTVEWASAQTLNAGNTFIRMWMIGGLYRRVL